MDYEKLAVDLIRAVKNRLCLENSGGHEVWCQNKGACDIVREALKDTKIAQLVYPNA